jgi:hypothetical protein
MKERIETSRLSCFLDHDKLFITKKKSGNILKTLPTILLTLTLVLYLLVSGISNRGISDFMIWGIVIFLLGSGLIFFLLRRFVLLDRSYVIERISEDAFTIGGQRIFAKDVSELELLEDTDRYGVSTYSLVFRAKGLRCVLFMDEKGDRAMELAGVIGEFVGTKYIVREHYWFML